MADIYKQKTKQAINPDLFSISNNAMKEAIDKGAKALTGNVADQALINELKTNATVFSAFKNHHQTSAITALLIGDDGKPVSFAKFKKEALKVSNKHLKSWLKTEYNTAHRRAITASKFQEYKATADIYPNLEWTPSRSNNPREAHIKFYGLVLPIEDPFWSNNFPGNDWGCACGLKRTKQGAGIAPGNTPKPPAGLDGNPAFTKQIIAKSHPYYKGLSADEAINAKKFAGKSINTEMITWAKTFVKDQYKPLIIKSKHLQTGQLSLTRKSVKDVVKQFSDPFLKTYPRVLKQDIQNWEYLGYKKPKYKNLDAEYFTYYKTSYGGQDIYMNVKVLKGIGEKLYKITKGVTENIIKKPLPKK